jgi:hypothetical protein
MLTRDRRRLGAVMAVAAALGCATNPAPSGVLLPAEALPTSTGGGFVRVQQKAGGITEGELLAAYAEGLHVQTRWGPRHVHRRDIHEARLAGYQTHEKALTGWTVLGTVSTISHGFFLVLSAPLWLLIGGTSAGLESRSALLVYPDGPLTDFVVYARYPQGMPGAMAAR